MAAPQSPPKPAPAPKPKTLETPSKMSPFLEANDDDYTDESSDEVEDDPSWADLPAWKVNVLRQKALKAKVSSAPDRARAKKAAAKEAKLAAMPPWMRSLAEK